MHKLILQAGILLLVTTVGTTLRAQGGDVNTLRGIQGVQVLVGGLGAVEEEAGLHAADIQTDVELKLRLAGIKVLTKEEWLKEPGAPSLGVRVSLLLNRPAAPGLAIFAIALQLHQSVTLTRGPFMSTSAITWGDEAFGSAGKDNIRQIRDGVKDMVDGFINAYLSVNPKK